ncbi:hypothetical protein KC322_g47 [Hortaea werneckii]|nr:hypothetical protein KC322_g47 [Hortaea werneckii]
MTLQALVLRKRSVFGQGLRYGSSMHVRASYEVLERAIKHQQELRASRWSTLLPTAAIAYRVQMTGR